MCNYCRKLTQSAYRLRSGYDVNIGMNGEVFIDFFNNLITHIEGCSESIEVSIPIKFCPWCGDKVKED